MRKIGFLICFSVLAFGCGIGKGKSKGSLSDFKVEDTSTVDKIFLADMGGNTVLLTKEKFGWRVNDKYDVRPDLISNLLVTIRRVEVKQFVPKPAVENILKSLAVTGTKVEIYQKGKLSKTYYVGGPTQDHYGTYMLLEGSDVPFICYVPGFRGYLTNHYIPMEVEWRDRKIFSYDIKQIESVKVEFFREPDMSWEIRNVDNAHFKLKSLKTGQDMPDFDTLRVKDVLQCFKVMGFEGFATVDKSRMDSVKTNYGLYRVSASTRDGRKRFVDLYEIPLPPGTLDMLGRPTSVDVDRMYGVVDGENVTICQYFTFDPVTIPITAFMPTQQRRKEN